VIELINNDNNYLIHFFAIFPRRMLKDAMDAPTDLGKLLKIASALIDTSPAPKKIGHLPVETLSTVLLRRLIRFDSLQKDHNIAFLPDAVQSILDHYASNRPPVTTQQQLELATSKIAFCCLVRLSQLLRSPTLASSSSAAPPLGSRDVKLVQTLSGMVARWGLASLIEQGLLPRALGGKGMEGKFVELVDEPRVEELEEMAKGLVEVLIPSGTKGNGLPAAETLLNPIRSLLLPSLYLPLVAGLLQLAYGDPSIPWAGEALKKMLDACVFFKKT